MPDACQVQFCCPPMKIWPAPDAGLFFHRTDAEPMVAKVRVWDADLTISPVTIPPTLSRPTGLLEWTVDACVGEGKSGEKCKPCNGYGYFTTVGGYKTRDCLDCNGSGWLGNRVRVELPKERVAFHWRDKFGQHRNAQEPITTFEDKCWLKGHFGLFLIAEAIDALVTLWLADGRVFKGTVTFPDCRIKDPLFSPEAEVVTTTGGELVEVKR